MLADKYKSKENFIPIFVDGVKKLHAQLFDAYEKASKMTEHIIGIPLKMDEEDSSFSIFVDFGENQDYNRIKGYFIHKSRILRFLPIEFDKALLYPVRNHRYGSDQTEWKGISEKRIKELQDEKEVVTIRFSLIREIESPKLFMSSIFKSSFGRSFSDDLGKLKYLFPEISELRLVDIPEKFSTANFTLVGKQYYAPFTTKEDAYCVLYAEINNEYDSNAIKVLRWLPNKKGIECDQRMGFEKDGGDVFFELGYISRQENSELHEFMVSNGAQLLFGTMKENEISILGSVKIFQTNDLKYPRCLYKISLK